MTIESWLFVAWVAAWLTCLIQLEPADWRDATDDADDNRPGDW